jgi:molybdate transport system substrate-binding protein
MGALNNFVIYMMKFLMFFTATLSFFSSMVTHAEPLTIAVAANVKYAYDELAVEFKNETGVEVQSVLGATGTLAAQVKNGAPYDVLISADTETPDALFNDGFAVGKSKIYAYGTLVLWTKNTLDLSKGIELLSDSKIQKIAIANPKLAPYGRAAKQALQTAKLYVAVEAKLVYGESIAQTAQFVDSGAADIGFIAKSIVLAPEMAGKGRWLEVPKNSYEPIAQAVVILKHGAQTQADNTQRFVNFLFTPQARTIFAKYGYTLP